MDTYRESKSSYNDSDAPSEYSSDTSIKMECVTDKSDTDKSDTDRSDSETSSEDSTSSDDSSDDDTWSDARRLPPRTTFLGSQGPTVEAEVEDKNSPLDYFQLIFDDDLMTVLVDETNRYASEFRSTSWKPTNKDEIKVVFGLMLLTGLIDKKRKLASYWSTDELVSTPYFGKCMGMNRFQRLIKFLNFNDNGQRPANCNDMTEVYNHIITKWRDLYDLGEHIRIAAIDEAMLKQRSYRKSKRVKYGITSYILVDANSHYCWNLNIFHRMKMNLSDAVHGLLTEQCYHLWHTLYICSDSFYNSVALSKRLLNQKIHTVGTFKKHRGEPKEIKNPQNMKHSEIRAKDNGKVVVLAWKDKKIVKATTTKHDASTCNTKRKGRRGESEVADIPKAIIDYNKHMSEVDHLDQMLSYYPCTKSLLKWKKVFFYLMTVSVHNCFVLYKSKTSGEKMTYYKFYKKLVKQLCIVKNPSEAQMGAGCGNAQRIDPPERLRGGFTCHRLELLPSTPKQKVARRRCRVCARNGKRTCTAYYCKDCNVPLCRAPCYGLYHTKAKFA